MSRWVMALSRQILLEEHFPALAEPVGELFAVIGEHLIADAVATQGVGEGQAHRPPGRSRDDRGGDTKPGVVIDPGHDLALGRID